MKNGGKNKSVAFIILVSVYTVYLNIYTHTQTHTHTHTTGQKFGIRMIFNVC